MIQDERALIEFKDIEFMSYVYELQSKAKDPNIHEFYRSHYAKKLVHMSAELAKISSEFEDAVS